jgi:hypothetical protein
MADTYVRFKQQALTLVSQGEEPTLIPGHLPKGYGEITVDVSIVLWWARGNK